MRKKVLCIVIPIITLLILGGVGAFLAYWFTRKPAEMTDGMTP
jgi:hypothetical protein